MKLKLQQIILFIGIFLFGIVASSLAASAPKYDSIPIIAIFLKNGDIIQVKDFYYSPSQKTVAYNPFDEKTPKSKPGSHKIASYKKQIPIETVEQIKYINGLVFYQDPDFNSTKMQGKVKYTHYFLDSERYYYRGEELDAYYATTHITQASKKCREIYKKANNCWTFSIGLIIVAVLLGLIVSSGVGLLSLSLAFIPLLIRNGFMKKAVDVYNSEQGY